MNSEIKLLKRNANECGAMESQKVKMCKERSNSVVNIIDRSIKVRRFK